MKVRPLYDLFNRLNDGKEEERSEEEQMAQLEQDFRREEMELGRLE